MRSEYRLNLPPVNELAGFGFLDLLTGLDCGLHLVLNLGTVAESAINRLEIEG